MATTDLDQQKRLLDEFAERQKIPRDELVCGFATHSDQYGGFVTYPLVSDVQDEALRDELIERGLSPRDAEHITQTVCNSYDVFLTRDECTIIKPHREWLQTRCPTLGFRLPSELLEEVRESQGRD